MLTYSIAPSVGVSYLSYDPKFFVVADMGSYLATSIETFVVGYQMALAMQAHQLQPGADPNPIVAAAAGGHLGDFPAVASALGGGPETELVAHGAR